MIVFMGALIVSMAIGTHIATGGIVPPFHALGGDLNSLLTNFQFC